MNYSQANKNCVDKLRSTLESLQLMVHGKRVIQMRGFSDFRGQIISKCVWRPVKFDFCRAIP